MVEGGDPAWRLDRRAALARLASAAAGTGLTIMDPLLGELPRGDLAPSLRAARAAGARWLGKPAAYARFPVVLAPAASAEVLPFAALEGLASGTPVVMTAHRGVEGLPREAVVAADDNDVLRRAVERFAMDSDARRTAEADGLRLAIRTGSYRERLREIARAVGITVTSPENRITVILAVDGDAGTEPLVDAIAGQERSPDQVVIGARSWSAGRDLQGRLEQACPGLPTALVEQPATLDPSAAAARMAAVATGRWLLAKIWTS